MLRELLPQEDIASDPLYRFGPPDLHEKWDPLVDLCILDDIYAAQQRGQHWLSVIKISRPDNQIYRNDIITYVDHKDPVVMWLNSAKVVNDQTIEIAVDANGTIRRYDWTQKFSPAGESVDADTIIVKAKMDCTPAWFFGSPAFSGTIDMETGEGASLSHFYFFRDKIGLGHGDVAIGKQALGAVFDMRKLTLYTAQSVGMHISRQAKLALAHSVYI